MVTEKHPSVAGHFYKISMRQREGKTQVLRRMAGFRARLEERGEGDGVRRAL
jgi:hypothetical protein